MAAISSFEAFRCRTTSLYRNSPNWPLYNRTTSSFMALNQNQAPNASKRRLNSLHNRCDPNILHGLLQLILARTAGVFRLKFLHNAAHFISRDTCWTTFICISNAGSRSTRIHHCTSQWLASSTACLGCVRTILISTCIFTYQLEEGCLTSCCSWVQHLCLSSQCWSLDCGLSQGLEGIGKIGALCCTAGAASVFRLKFLHNAAHFICRDTCWTTFICISNAGSRSTRTHHCTSQWLASSTACLGCVRTILISTCIFTYQLEEGCLTSCCSWVQHLCLSSQCWSLDCGLSQGLEGIGKIGALCCTAGAASVFRLKFLHNAAHFISRDTCWTTFICISNAGSRSTRIHHCTSQWLASSTACLGCVRTILISTCIFTYQLEEGCLTSCCSWVQASLLELSVLESWLRPFAGPGRHW